MGAPATTRKPRAQAAAGAQGGPQQHKPKPPDVPSLVASLHASLRWRAAATVGAEPVVTHTAVVGRSPLVNAALARRLVGASTAPPPPPPLAAAATSAHEYRAHPGAPVFELHVQPLLCVGDAKDLCDQLASLVSHRDMSTYAPGRADRVYVLLHLARRLCLPQVELCLRHLMDAFHDSATFVFTCCSQGWLPPALASRCACVRASLHLDASATLTCYAAAAQLPEPDGAAGCDGLMARAEQDLVSAALMLHLQPAPFPAGGPLEQLVRAYLSGALTLRELCLRVTAGGVEVAHLARAALRVLAAGTARGAACVAETMAEATQMMADMEARAAGTSKELFVLEHHMERLALLLLAPTADAQQQQLAALTLSSS